MAPEDHAARRQLEIRPRETSPVFSALSRQLECGRGRKMEDLSASYVLRPDEHPGTIVLVGGSIVKVFDPSGVYTAARACTRCVIETEQSHNLPTKQDLSTLTFALITSLS